MWLWLCVYLVCVCVCTGANPLRRQDEELHQSLPSTLVLAVVEQLLELRPLETGAVLPLQALVPPRGQVWSIQGEGREEPFQGGEEFVHLDGSRK